MKWLHIIGICGKVTSNIAKMFIDEGWFVTGSDIQFSEPAKGNLDRNKIPYVSEYNFKHLTKAFWEEELGKKIETEDVPNLVLYIESITEKNKEYLFAKNKNLDLRPFSKILGEYLVKKESIVVAGTAGKTTTTALTVKVLRALNVDPSYMIGAEVKDFKESILNTKSEFSVLEGDEYYNPILSDGAKFLEYKPKYLILTNVGYEHHEIFPTPERYVEEFGKLVKLIPKDGLIVAKADDKNIDQILKDAKCQIIRYGEFKQIKEKNYWSYKKLGPTIEIHEGNGDSVIKTTTNLLGVYNLENITAVTALICNLPMNKLSKYLDTIGTENLKIIANALSEFEGAKKRLEIVYSNDQITVIDDFGIAPDRAKNSLTTIKKEFPDHKIVAVFEPNAGSRPMDEKTFKSIYKGVFNDVDSLLIPKLSDLTKGILENDKFVKYLTDLNFKPLNLDHQEVAQKIDKILSDSGKVKVVVVFFSAYRMQSEIDKLIKKLNT